MLVWVISVFILIGSVEQIQTTDNNLKIRNNQQNVECFYKST